MSATAFDVARVRGLYPTLGGTTAHLDGPFSALQPESVIRAIVSTLRAAPTQPGSASERSVRAESSVARARRAVADLVGASADSVVLGASPSSLASRFATVAAREWQLGDEVLLSRLDDDLLVQAWASAARSAGAVVRWAEVDVETGELPSWQYERLVGRRTRVVCLPLAHPATGTAPDVRAIAEMAHRHDALVVVDATTAVPHVPIDLAELGADLILIWTAAFGGPGVAAIAAAPGVLDRLPDDPPAQALARFEVGPLPVELLDGVTAAVDHLASLDEGATGPRRERVRLSVTAARGHARALFDRLQAGMRSLSGVTLLGTTPDRLPMAAFTVDGHSPRAVGDFLRHREISVWTGPSGAGQLFTVLGADELGGASFVGVMPHNTWGEVEMLVAALGELTS